MRRLKLTPMQRDIMVTLEEAGAETSGTVYATVKPSARGDFDRAVDGLIAQGLVRREDSSAYKGKTELVLTEAGRDALGR